MGSGCANRGLRPETLAVYRRFANLHARLAPYSRTAALQAEAQGLPIMRAMPLAFPTDPAVHDRQWQHQYLYGPDLLVAPVYWWGESRQVYLPEGVWIDYFSGRRVTGPLRQRVPTPLDTIPVYVAPAPHYRCASTRGRVATRCWRSTCIPVRVAAFACPTGPASTAGPRLGGG